MGHERFVEWTLPVQIVARELKKYREREDKENNPCGHTWPTVGRKELRKRAYKDLTKFVVKFKRRERWEMLKADLGSEYLERVHEAALMTLADGQSFHQ